jgi:prepilin-type N-terminal cleavage/methylation domain-containing protein
MSAKTTGRGGFTLVELLAVLGIIGLIMSIVLGGVNVAMKTAKKHRAGIETQNVEQALRAYVNEYYTFPRGLHGATDAGIDTETTATGGLATDDTVVRLFRGENIVYSGRDLNSHRTVFLEIGERSLAGNVFVDPWGNGYRYMCDFNYDNVIQIKYADVTVALTGQTMAVWSRGPDGLDHSPAARRDDIVSWR